MNAWNVLDNSNTEQNGICGGSWGWLMQILDMLADLKRWDVDDYYDPDATTGTVYSRWGVSCVLIAYGILRGIKAAPVSWEGNQKKKKPACIVELWVPNLSPIFFCIFCWPSQLNFSQHHHVSPGISAENACRFEDVRPSCCIHRRSGTLCSDNFLNQQGFKAGSREKKRDFGGSVSVVV